MPKTTVPDIKTAISSRIKAKDFLAGADKAVNRFPTPPRPPAKPPVPLDWASGKYNSAANSILGEEMERRRQEEMLKAAKELYIEQRLPMYTARPFSGADLTPELLEQLNKDYAAGYPNTPNLNVKNLAKVRK